MSNIQPKVTDDRDLFVCLFVGTAETSGDMTKSQTIRTGGERATFARQTTKETADHACISRSSAAQALNQLIWNPKRIR
jgi:hypothetical protein